MGVLDALKKTIVDNLPDVVTNPEISGQTKDMLYKFDKIALIKGSRLIVGPSQEAIFVRNGVIDAVFGPGSYNLETDNIPIAKQILELAYGGDSPNRAEIWFVNKTVMMDIAWGTPQPLSMEERKFEIPLTLKVRCNGSISLRINDSQKLFTEMAGQGKVFSIDNFQTAMRGMMVSRLQRVMGEFMSTNDAGFVTLQQNVTVIEKPLGELMHQELVPYGLGLEGCYVKSFTVVEDDAWERYKRYEDEYFNIHAEERRIKRLGMAEAERLASLGTTYDRERQFGVMDKAAGNNTMAAMASPVGLGVGIMAGQVLGDSMKIMAGDTMGAAQPAQPSAPPAEEGFTCPACSAKYGKSVKFCPECGYIVKKACSACSAELKGEKFCPECGKKITICSSCGADNAADAVNCAKCQKTLTSTKSCSSCGFTPENPTKFCPECGTPM